MHLLTELQLDADRPNVELARLVGLSPAATLNRVRRPEGVGRRPADHRAAGLHDRRVSAAGLRRGDARPARDARHRRFQNAVGELTGVISADWVDGGVDALLIVVARDVGSSSACSRRLSTRGGARA